MDRHSNLNAAFSFRNPGPQGAPRSQDEPHPFSDENSYLQQSVGRPDQAQQCKPFLGVTSFEPKMEPKSPPTFKQPADGETPAYQPTYSILNRPTVDEDKYNLFSEPRQQVAMDLDHPQIIKQQSLVQQPLSQLKIKELQSQYNIKLGAARNRSSDAPFEKSTAYASGSHGETASGGGESNSFKASIFSGNTFCAARSNSGNLFADGRIS